MGSVFGYLEEGATIFKQIWDTIHPPQQKVEPTPVLVQAGINPTYVIIGLGIFAALALIRR